jgi:cytochrome c biogenesis protein CcmG/thiol:disulfide interchange protein DsbE
MRGVKAVSVAVVLALLGLLVWDAAHGSGGGIAPKVDRGETVAAPALRLPSFGPAGDLSLASYRGKVVVVNFWASWCDPCVDEAPLLATMAAEQGKAGVVFVGIDANDVVDDARQFAKRFGLDYAQAHDGDGSEKDRFGVTGFPETFVIDRDGRAVEWFPGQIDADGLRAAIAKAGNA